MARASLKLDEDYESEEEEEEEEKGDEDKDDGNQDTEVADDKHDEDEEEERIKQRKDYTRSCRICNQPMCNTGHMHFRGNIGTAPMLSLDRFHLRSGLHTTIT